MASRGQRGSLLREGFNQRHAERPDVRGGRKRRRSRFRSVVKIKLARYFARFTSGEERIAGKLELISGGKKVGRLKARMYEAVAMQINKCIEDGFEHVANFGRRKRTLGKDLREVFLGIFHHHEEAIPVLQTAAADVEDTQ